MASIYYLSRARLPNQFASSLQMVNMCEAFAENGCEVTLFCRTATADPGMIFENYGVAENFRIRPIHSNSESVLGKARFFLALSAMVKALPKPDLLYARNLKSFLFLDGLHCPRAMETHSFPEGFLERQLTKRLLARSDFLALIGINAALVEDHLAGFPSLDKERTLAAPSGCNPETMEADALELPGRRQALKVGYVGHLYPGKGIEVIGRLSEYCPDVDFHIVGGRDQEIETCKAAYPFDNLFFHGYVAPTMVPGYLRAFEVVLTPVQRSVNFMNSKKDIGRYTSPIKIFEYMMAGVPIIASDTPAIRKILRDEHTALLVSPDHIDSWVRAIRRLRGDGALSQRLSRQAKDLVLAEYTWRKRARKILRLCGLA